MAYFQPNCTLPPGGVSYVAAPNTRSTLDILWSSLATIIACTYSVLHLNVPEQRRGRDPGWKGDMKWTLRRFWTKLKWCIVTIFIPEFIFTKAVWDWWNARKQLKRLQCKCPDICQTITLTHMLFADMGGFALAYHTGKPSKADNDVDSHSSNTIEQTAWIRNSSLDLSPNNKTQKSKREARYWHLDAHVLGDPAPSHEHTCDTSGRQRGGQDGLTLPEPLEGDGDTGSSGSQADTEAGRISKSTHDSRPDDDTQSFKGETEYWHLEAYVLVEMILNKHLPLELPPLEEITDRSKSDVLTKTITLLQICYFVLAVLMRVGHAQAICELELGTVAFVVCSALTYVVTFPKPKSVETPIVLSGLASEETMRHVREYAESPTKSPLSSDEKNRNKGCPPRNDMLMGTDATPVSRRTLLTAVLFSSIHIAGWNLSFPSVPDMWLWRASALATSGAPVIFLCCGWTSAIPLFLIPIGLIGSQVIYFVGRLVLIVEMFRGLAYLPPDAFTTTWTANIPHIR